MQAWVCFMRLQERIPIVPKSLHRVYTWGNFNLNNNYLKTTRLPPRATLRHCCLTILGRRTFLPHLFLIRCIIGLFPLRLSYWFLRFQPDLCFQIAITICTLFGEIIKATIIHTVELSGSSAGGIYSHGWPLRNASIKKHMLTFLMYV